MDGHVKRKHRKKSSAVAVPAQAVAALVDAPVLRQALVMIDLRIWPLHEIRARLDMAFGGHGVTMLDDVLQSAVASDE